MKENIDQVVLAQEAHVKQEDSLQLSLEELQRRLAEEWNPEKEEKEVGGKRG